MKTTTKNTHALATALEIAIAKMLETSSTPTTALLDALQVVLYERVGGETHEATMAALRAHALASWASLYRNDEDAARFARVRAEQAMLAPSMSIARALDAWTRADDAPRRDERARREAIGILLEALDDDEIAGFVDVIADGLVTSREGADAKRAA